MSSSDDLDAPIWPEDLSPELLEELREVLDLPRASARDLLSSIQARAEYQLGEEIGHGGMGLVREARDENLRRTVAMKVVRLLDPAKAPLQEPTPAEQARLVHRFLREARIAGQLSHPGIVPVHELGRLPDGTVYFTMPVVRGNSLDEVFEWSRRNERDWSLPRALGVLQRVCETLAYAHQRGVIHRDVKPENVMVGSFGETYVLDWGLAKAVGSPSWLEGSAEPRDEAPIDQGEDAMLTKPGAAMGSAPFMAPEQAAGKASEISPAVDVYAVGALIYTLLSGFRPYQDGNGQRSRAQIIAAILAGPPRPLAELAPGQPAELIAIAEKAMARDPGHRYASMEAMAQDLRAFLENRVVQAHRTGAVVELWKWVQRNKAVAAMASVAIVAVIGASVWNAEVQAASRREALLSGDVALLPYLESEAERLWPALPETLPAMDTWLAQAQELVSRADLHEARLAEMADGVLRATEDGQPRFEDPDRRAAYEKQRSLVSGLRRLADQGEGKIREVGDRRAFAATVEERTVTGPLARERWGEAIRSITDPSESPLYRGLEITPQLGLLPVGKDPKSGLWEFADLQTGEAPARDDSGELVLSEATGLVFVLLPGGELLMGAQAQEATASNYVPFASPSDGPVQSISLDPFFLSKYEMTQAQWMRHWGSNPSFYDPSFHQSQAYDAGWGAAVMHPVENVPWSAATEAMRRLALILPTEAQWEYAARGETGTPWWTGSGPASLEGSENLVDQSALAAGLDWVIPQEWDDGFPVHAPVGSFRPNPFGIHDILGNVGEWCLDRWGSLDLPTRPGDGLRLTEGVLACVQRGGCFESTANEAAVVLRKSFTPEISDYCFGIRPARPLR